jgi:phenylacetate-CoA ligase
VGSDRAGGRHTASQLVFRTLTGASWPGLTTGGNAQILALYQRLRETEWLDPDEIVQGQLQQLRTLIAHASAHVPFYRETYGRAGIAAADIRTMADVRRLPLLDKAHFRAARDAFTPEKLPAYMGEIALKTTSGTTGIPIAVGQTMVNSLWWLAFYLRDLDWCGIDARLTRATIKPFVKPGVDDPQLLAGLAFPNWNGRLDKLIETGRAFRMDIQRDPKGQLAWLRKIAPAYLMSYPSNLVVLADEIARGDAGVPGLASIQIMGEALSTAQRARIEQQFGVPVHNLYSCVEAGYLASPCPEGHGLHVHAENVILEVLGDDDRPCAPGESGRVVVTPLQGFASPMIRYELGDRVAVGAARCPCGRGLPLLTEVEGKVRPMLVRADGTRRASSEIANFCQRPDVAVAQYRCVQEAPGRVRLEVVPAAGWGEEQAARMRAFLAGFIGEGGAAELVVVAAIPRTGGGKHRDVVGMG